MAIENRPFPQKGSFMFQPFSGEKPMSFREKSLTVKNPGKSLRFCPLVSGFVGTLVVMLHL